MIMGFIMSSALGALKTLLLKGLTEKLLIKLFLEIAESFVKKTTNKVDDMLVADLKSRFS